eukprot:gnl/TRDRNA2_/TRDRNA2_86002_c0_seq1.p1 gnl/TRDRNA2_/TRDRNA2_86002_c0~~gnl/TRDRNA2_/TRDRNA2_86002_c0_seq1.p1  ORF type:complete len:411 (-),score=102.34 gnl/TRDRNA2_/TRDRNA2_86002_c0_seq1:26-1258(-)
MAAVEPVGEPHADDEEVPADLESQHAGVPGEDELSAVELKAAGNEAYQNHELHDAVNFWNRALRRFVDEMSPGGPGPNPLSEESRTFEKSLYLNLAQGYLKLGQHSQALRRFVDEMSPGGPGPNPLSEESRTFEKSLYLNLAQGYLKLGQHSQALRACTVVVQTHPQEAKARYRAAEACLALRQFEEAANWLRSLLEADPGHAEASRLLQRCQAEARRQKQEEKAAARRMFAGSGGYSDERKKEVPEAAGPEAAMYRSLDEGLSNINPEGVAAGLDIGAAAARKARELQAAREARESTAALPEPTTLPDLDEFRAKVAARTKKMNESMARSRRKRANAEHGLKLDWLRGGDGASGFADFTSALRDEAHAIEEQDRTTAEAGAKDEEEEEIKPLEAENPPDTSSGVMHEMD